MFTHWKRLEQKEWMTASNERKVLLDVEPSDYYAIHGVFYYNNDLSIKLFTRCCCEHFEIPQNFSPVKRRHDEQSTNIKMGYSDHINWWLDMIEKDDFLIEFKRDSFPSKNFRNGHM